MEQILSLLGKLDPNQLVLTLVLIGVYRIFDSHGKKMVSAVEAMSEQVDGLAKEVKAVAVDIKGIREDLGEIVEKIEEHDSRIGKLEKVG